MISTHTLTWSVTGQKNSRKQPNRFQLTRSRGAWQGDITTLLSQIYFNSHAHVERDYIFNAVSNLIKYFNSHAHVERDDMNILLAESLQHFNSHAHVERDGNTVMRTDRISISTHTLTWSVTRIFVIITAPCLFQLTRSRGAWPIHQTCKALWNNFNSHAHVERD